MMRTFHSIHAGVQALACPLRLFPAAGQSLCPTASKRTHTLPENPEDFKDILRQFGARQTAEIGYFSLMRDLPQPEVIFTHESDLDGLLSGILLQRLAKQRFGTDVRLEAYHYNFWKQRDLREKAAWAADFTFETRMDKLGWIIVDHHVTDVTPRNAQLIHDINKSAASLCYELCKEHGIQ